MTVPADVAKFLKKRRPDSYCIDCIAEELSKNRRAIQAITAPLALTDDFNQDSGGCVKCHNRTTNALRSN